jgi:hypothetical protein
LKLAFTAEKTYLKSPPGAEEIGSRAEAAETDGKMRLAASPPSSVVASQDAEEVRKRT